MPRQLFVCVVCLRPGVVRAALLAASVATWSACNLTTTDSGVDTANPGAAVVGNGELRLSAVLPTAARPGRRVALRGDGFPNTVDGEQPPQVTVGGALATVLASSRTLVFATVPDGVTGAVDIRVTLGGKSVGPVSMTVLAPIPGTTAVAALRSRILAAPPTVTSDTAAAIAFDLEQVDE